MRLIAQALLVLTWTAALVALGWWAGARHTEACRHVTSAASPQPHRASPGRVSGDPGARR